MHDDNTKLPDIFTDGRPDLISKPSVDLVETKPHQLTRRVGKSSNGFAMFLIILLVFGGFVLSIMFAPWAIPLIILGAFVIQTVYVIASIVKAASKR